MDNKLKPSDQSSVILDSHCLKLNQETILELGVNPVYKRKIVRPQYHVSGVGHPCGDLLEFCMFVNQGLITDIFHHGCSCCMTTATADILCHHLIGQEVRRLISISREDVIDLQPIREGCIALPFNLLRELYANTQTL